MCFNGLTKESHYTCNTSDIEQKYEILGQALKILKEPNFFETIASCSTPVKQNVHLPIGQIELDNMKVTENEDKKNLTTQVTPILHQQVTSYDDMCLEFSSPKSRVCAKPKKTI